MGDSSNTATATTNEAIEASDDAVEISVPLRAEHAATLRVIVASLGSDHDLTIDEIDDVKLAMSEVFTLMCDDAEAAGATRAHARFTATGDTISIHLHRGLSGGTFELDMLASTILTSVVDSHVIDEGGITIVKRAGQPGS